MIVIPNRGTRNPTSGGGASDEPVFNGAVDTALWSDDFDRYNSIIEMQRDSSCGAAFASFPKTVPNNEDACVLVGSEYALTTGRSGSGKALRSSIVTSGSQQSIAWLTPWHPGGQVLTYSQRGIVVQYWFRVSSGGTPGGAGCKWMENWWGSDSAGQGRLQWSLDGEVFHSVFGSNPGGTVVRTHQPIGPYITDLNDNVWYRCTLLFLRNLTSSYTRTGGGSTSSTEVYSGTSSRDGRIAVWWNGIKVLDYSQATVGVTPPGGTGIWCSQSDVDFIPGVSGSNSVGNTAFLEFPGVFNQSPTTFTLDHDDLVVWATNG